MPLETLRATASWSTRVRRGGAPDAAAAAITGVPGDRLGARYWVAGGQARDVACELARELDVFA